MEAASVPKILSAMMVCIAMDRNNASMAHVFQAVRRVWVSQVSAEDQASATNSSNHVTIGKAQRVRMESALRVSPLLVVPMTVDCRPPAPKIRNVLLPTKLVRMGCA